MHHQRCLSELQEVSSLRRGVWTRRTSKAGARRCAPLWVWLLLAALVVPGTRSFLSEEQEELLVELHNHYRGQVWPSASAMLPLRWDPSLKVIAEGYAAKCVWNHNPDLEDTGENLFVGTGPLDLREALEKWFLEHLDYDFQNNSCDEDKMCGHYTQMVWAGTHRVGCAFHLCNNMDGLDWERVSFLVCNYYPAGNYEDERPFVEGDWCSRCPENLQKCENNLCVADTEEEEEEEGEEEDETFFRPPATSDPSFRPEDEEVVPPPATTDTNVPPATTTAAAATSTPSIPNPTTEDAPPPATPAPGTRPPKVPSTTLEERENEEEKEQKRKETIETTEGKGERNVTRNIYHNKKVSASNGASVSPPSLLLACLTGILTIRP